MQARNHVDAGSNDTQHDDAHVRDEEHIDMLHALKTAFSSSGDSEMFLARAGDKIRQMEDAIIETCTKHRLRIDDNLYSLLEARDAISEQLVDLDKSVRTAADVTATVDVAVADICDKTTIRKNLDAALAVAARTRKLARLYARVEDTIDSKRLYTAFRLLRVLEDDMRTILPNTVIQQLVPDTRRLRGRIATQTRRSMQTWFVEIRPFELALGAYGMRHAVTQALLHQTMLDAPVGTLGEPFALLPLLSQTPPRRKTSGRPWIPMVMPHAVATEPVPPPLPSARPPSAPFRPWTAGTSMPLRGGSGNLVSDDLPAPMIFLRPLLQAVLVGDGLGLTHELAAEYRRARLTRLQQILDSLEHSNSDGDEQPTTDHDSTIDTLKPKLGIDTEVDDVNSTLATGMERGHPDTDYGDADDGGQESGTGMRGRAFGHSSSSAKDVSRAQQIERLACKVSGFFIVERAVEANLTSTELVSRDIVDNEWWHTAYARLLAVFKEYEENGLESPADKAIVRGVEEGVERFAEAHGLIG